MTDELNHHGVLGMHWGIRRYQNKDGTRTPAGKKRYDENYTSKAEGNTLTDAEQEKKANKVAKQLTKDKWSWGKKMYGTESHQAIVDLITTDQLKSIRDSRAKLDLVLSENKYDGNKIDEEAYSLLESNKDHYFSQAKEIFKRINGYEPSSEDGTFIYAFELAQDDTLKRHPEIKKKDATIAKAVNDHMDLLGTVIDNSLIGKYGNMPINAKNPNSGKIRYAINEVVYELDSNPMLVEKILNGR